MLSLWLTGYRAEWEAGKGEIQSRSEVSPRAVLYWRRWRSVWKYDSKMGRSRGSKTNSHSWDTKPRGRMAGAMRARTRNCRRGRYTRQGARCQQPQRLLHPYSTSLHGKARILS